MEMFLNPSEVMNAVDFERHLSPERIGMMRRKNLARLRNQCWGELAVLDASYRSKPELARLGERRWTNDSVGGQPSRGLERASRDGGPFPEDPIDLANVVPLRGEELLPTRDIRATLTFAKCSRHGSPWSSRANTGLTPMRSARAKGH
jgi:hypothetical protein